MTIVPEEFFSKRKYLFIALCITFLSVVILLYRWQMSDTQDRDNIIEYTFQGRKLKVYLADQPAEWQQGLMYYKKLKYADGMLFTFPDSQKRTFWNHNTFMDLDVYWLQDDTVVGKSFLPSIEKEGFIITVTSPEPVNMVLELER